MSKRKSCVSIILSLVLVLSTFTFFGSKSEAATVTVTSVAELQQAINNSSGDTEIVLANDMQLTATVTIPAGKSITLQGGVTLTTKRAVASHGRISSLMEMLRTQTIRVL